MDKINLMKAEPIVSIVSRDKWNNVLNMKISFIEESIEPIVSDILPLEVIESWKIAKENNVDRFNWPPPNVSSYELDEIINDNQLLIEVAKPFIAGYGEILDDYNMLLYDKNGIILDYTLVRKDEQISIGGIRSENVTGTTAHNLAARHKRPVQMIGPVNYCKALENNLTSAAPILSEQGELLGTIVLYQRAASEQWRLGHSLGWITSTAVAIASQLHLRLGDAKLKMMDETFKATFDNSKEAFISIANDGSIINCNQLALNIMGEDENSINGRVKKNFFEIIVDDFSIKKAMNAKSTTQNIAIIIKSKPKKVYKADIVPFNGGAMIKIFTTKVNKNHISFDNIIHKSKVMSNLINMAKLVNKNPVNILLLGESGTGKELFAQALHNHCSTGPFVAINCASIPANLIESELFGYEKGAFTGADKEGRKGKIEHANGGTLFLDEIGDMPLELQPVFLRVLEDKQVIRVGGHKAIPVDFRIISATNRHLYGDVQENKFRSDLYFRLSVINLEIPALRERESDVIYLAEYFISKVCASFGLPLYSLSERAKIAISRYNWPGNVRQLENAITYAVSVASNNIIDENDLPKDVFNITDSEAIATLREIKATELEHMKKVVASSRSMEEAAYKLGMSRSTLYRKLK